jgi:hypothetical protein
MLTAPGSGPSMITRQQKGGVMAALSSALKHWLDRIPDFLFDCF